MKLVKISFQNFVAYSKHHLKLICAFVAFIFLLTLFAAFSVAITEKCTEIKNKTISSNYAISDICLDCDKLSVNYSDVCLTLVDITSQSDTLFNMPFDYITTEMIELVISDNIYQGNQGNVFSVYAGDNWDIFSENDFWEAGTATCDSFLLGRFPQSSNEIVVSRSFLNNYNITEDILGQTIKIVVARHNDRIILDEMYVCGILTEKYCSLVGHSSYGFSTEFSPSVLVSIDNAQIDAYAQCEIYLSFFDDWISVADIDYLYSINAHYIGQESMVQIRYMNNLQIIHKEIVLYVGLALICGIVLMVFLILEKLCEASERNSAMLMTVGVTHGQLLLIYIVQLILANLFAFIIACTLSIGVFEIINLVLLHILDTSLFISMPFFFTLQCVGCLSIFFLTMIAAIYIVFKLKRRQVKEWL